MVETPELVPHGRSPTDPLVANVHRLSSARENIFFEFFKQRRPGGGNRCVFVGCGALPDRLADGKPREVVLAKRFLRSWRPLMAPPYRVLALHAHPDDLEFQCAGALALLREAGCAVTMATMTPGDCGSAEHDAETIAAIRRGEARAAAERIGADYLCLEFRDMAVFNDA